MIGEGSDASTEKTERDNPSVDLNMADGDATMTLTLNFMNGIWMPEFNFTLLPVGLNKVDVLEAKLRDAVEEIEQLRLQVNELQLAVEPAVMRLNSSTACMVNGIIVWNGEAGRIFNESYFAVSEDHRQITILKSGMYQVSVRVAAVNTTNCASVGLQLNGADIAACVNSDPNNHQVSAQLFEVVVLQVNDVLQVRSGLSGATQMTALSNSFIISKLA